MRHLVACESCIIYCFLYVSHRRVFPLCLASPSASCVTWRVLCVLRGPGVCREACRATDGGVGDEET
ncbi:hypothetical protein Hamer_G023896 [Homarus americanus]|uniref:Uncharacterized protein n=1 Tax=Homarus americanus TaxID=6706 RepID=A0A8J5JBL2_HOMAM|nr:hypothetical protein Hamer_G023896 [Homarus americanus]